MPEIQILCLVHSDSHELKLSCSIGWMLVPSVWICAIQVASLLTLCLSIMQFWFLEHLKHNTNTQIINTTLDSLHRLSRDKQNGNKSWQNLHIKNEWMRSRKTSIDTTLLDCLKSSIIWCRSPISHTVVNIKIMSYISWAFNETWWCWLIKHSIIQSNTARSLAYTTLTHLLRQWGQVAE